MARSPNKPFPIISAFLTGIAAMGLSLIPLTVSAQEKNSPVPPKVLEPGLQITLVGSEPEIVTPIGAAFDQRGNLFVIESHTHQVKADYPGPKSDRVKVFTDSNGDGIPDKGAIFAEGFRASMNLAFGPDGVLYLVHRNGVIQLHDRDNNLVCEDQKPILQMETKETYPHNGLSGIAFGKDGWLYIGTGENMGQDYVLLGSDSVKWTGSGGAGAYVFRCKPDGSQLQEYARGAWNLFALEFDSLGNLFAVDNDPDGRPPCRLLHIIRGGDYGYQFRYGRSGLHPYVAWNGEIFGTLPMVAGTGEAPSDILNLDRARLPGKLTRGLLVTSWGDNQLELFQLKSQGSSFVGDKQIVVRGTETFRPVAAEVAPDGSVYITDWADRSYNVHQKGRIWRLSSIEPIKEQKKISIQPSPDQQLLSNFNSGTAKKSFRELLNLAAGEDPFVRSAAILALTEGNFEAELLKDVAHKNPEIRAAVLLALENRKSAVPDDQFKNWLEDESTEVRRLALIWIGAGKRKSLEPWLGRALKNQVSSTLFKTYVATLDLLQRENEITARTAPAVQTMVLKILADAQQPAGTRAMALTAIPNPNESAASRAILEAITSSDRELKLNAVRAALLLTNQEALTQLEAVAQDKNADSFIRAEAISALSAGGSKERKVLMDLVKEPQFELRLAALRALRSAASQSDLKTTVTVAQSVPINGIDAAVWKDQVSFSTQGAEKEERPATLEAWQKLLEKNGDKDRGRRAFFDPQLACARCHSAEGRGGEVGPDLSTIGRSNDRNRLVTSMIDPSREIGPLYGQLTVEMKSGETHSGVPLGIDFVDTLSLKLANGTRIKLQRDQVESIQSSTQSIMPSGLEKLMSVEEFRDLLAYLESMK